jgi:hypothetical protein
MQPDEVFFNTLKENLLFMRHQETQRMWIANVFVAIVVGFLAFIGKEGFMSLQWYGYMALTIISILCGLITLKLNYVFDKTQEATKKLLNDGKIQDLKEVYKNYLIPLESQGCWKLLRVRDLYLTLYGFAINLCQYEIK